MFVALKFLIIRDFELIGLDDYDVSFHFE